VSDTTIRLNRPAAGIGARTLDTILGQTRDVDAVGKKELTWGDCVVVETKNSVYSICALEEGYYLVSGGWFDSQHRRPVRITISGCTWGGSAIRHDIIAARGLFLEFGNRVTTTRIQNVSVIRGAGPELVN